MLELSGARIAEFTFFLQPERLFALFGLPPRLDAERRVQAGRVRGQRAGVHDDRPPGRHPE